MILIVKKHDSTERSVFDTQVCSFTCNEAKTEFKLFRADQVVTTLNPQKDFIAFLPDDALDVVVAFSRGEKISTARAIMYEPHGPWENDILERNIIE